MIVYKGLAAMHAANLKESTRRMLWNKAVNYSNATVAVTYSRTSGSYSYKLFNKKRVSWLSTHNLLDALEELQRRERFIANGLKGALN